MAVYATDNQETQHWIQMQIKTFTKWFNSKLATEDYPPIENLFTDLCDGIQIHRLLTALHRDPPQIQENPVIKIHNMENVNTLLDFITARGVTLVNIGAEDIVEGNEKLILGFVWTLISKMVFSEDLSSNVNLGLKSELLDWVKYVTRDYRNVNIENFTTSWKDGLGFNSLIHYFHPELVSNFYELQKENPSKNLEQAFSVAEKDLGISRLIDVEDLITDLYPDEKSIMTYLMMFYEKFKDVEKMKNAKFVMKNLFKNLDASYKERSILIAKKENFEKNKKIFEEEVSRIKEGINVLLQGIENLDKMNSILVKDSMDINSSFYSIQAFDAINNHKIDTSLEKCKVDYEYYRLDKILDVYRINSLIKECVCDDVLKIQSLKFNLEEFLSNSLKGTIEDSSKKIISEILSSTFENPRNIASINAFRKIFEGGMERMHILQGFNDLVSKNLNVAESIFKKFGENNEISFKNFKKIGHSINQSDFDLLDLNKEKSYSWEEVKEFAYRLSFKTYSKDTLAGAFKALDCSVINVEEFTGEKYENLLKHTRVGEKATLEDLSEELHK